MGRPELLAPAGDFEKLRYAAAYGADAVYLSGKAYGMRTASGNFDEEELRAAIRYCHERGVKAFVTVNVMMRPHEIDALPAYLELLEDAGADAVIVADLGVIPLVKRHAPHVRLHISTQASVTNHSAAAALHELGTDRIVLARELPLEEIREIRARTPRTLELEVFVHGSMCVSYSGRCLLSDVMTGRDANHGNCSQPCRWNYALMEEKRPGEYFPILEDEHGTYLMNSKDLCMIEHIPELVESGVDSFKIEGRVKTSYYAAVITGAYRRALDLYLRDPARYSLPPAIRDEVFKVSHRAYWTGFFFGEKNGQYLEDAAYIRDWDVCAYVTDRSREGLAPCVQKNKFSVGEQLELLSPHRDPVTFTLEKLFDQDGAPIASAPHPHMKVSVGLPVEAGPFDILRKKNS